MRRKVFEELGNVTEEAKGLYPPHFFRPFLFSLVGVTRLEGSTAVWPGLFAIHVFVAAPSSYCFPLLLSPLSSSASLSVPPPPPPPRLLLPNSGSRDVSVAAPPPASCLPFSPVCLVVFPYICPLFSLVSSPQLGSDDLLCVPPLVASTGVSSVLLLYG